MSERLTNNEIIQNHENSAQNHELNKSKPEIDEATVEKQQKDLLEASRISAENYASPSELLSVDKDEHKHGFHIGSHQLLKKDSYSSLLKQTRQSLPAVSRQFSKIVHQKNIEGISNVGAQTVARPSGLLGGGIGALVGSLTLLYTSKHYGFRYNYAFFLFTFLAGFIIGIIIEIIIRLFKRQR